MFIQSFKHKNITGYRFRFKDRFRARAILWSKFRSGSGSVSDFTSPDATVLNQLIGELELYSKGKLLSGILP